MADTSSNLPFSIVGGRGIRHWAQDSANPVIRDTARALISGHGGFRALEHPQRLNLPLASGEALVRIDPYRDAYGNLRKALAQSERRLQRETLHRQQLKQTVRDVVERLAAAHEGLAGHDNQGPFTLALSGVMVAQAMPLLERLVQDLQPLQIRAGLAELGDPEDIGSARFELLSSADQALMAARAGNLPWSIAP